MSITIDNKSKKKRYRFDVKYKDVNGLQKRKTSKWYNKKSECLEAERQFRITITKESNRITFLECANSYLLEKKDTVKPRTYREMERFVNEWYIPFHNIDIGNITPLRVREFFNNEAYDKYSVSYLERVYTTLNAIFEHAVIYYGLDVNPMKRVKKPTRSKQEMTELDDKMTIYSDADFMKFYESVPSNKFIYAYLFWVLYHTGLRKNEALSLRFCDFDGKALNVFQQYQDGRFTTLKTAESKRVLLVDNSVKEKIKELQSYYKTFPKYRDTWFIFGGFKQLPTTEIDRVKEKAIKLSGLPYIRIHDLRHSFATNMIEKGVNIVVVSRYLGHASIQMTVDRYTHPSIDAQNELIDVLNKL